MDKGFEGVKGRLRQAITKLHQDDPATARELTAELEGAGDVEALRRLIVRLEEGWPELALETRWLVEEDLGEEFSQRLTVADIDLDSGFDSMRPMRERILDILGDVSGKEILDLGCGLGRLSVALARKGAKVTALDISQGMLDFASRLAAKYGVDGNMRFILGKAERLELGDNSFDIVVGSGILHHVDVELALEEIVRVLRPGGEMLFEEPLGHNPFLNLYRVMTPSLRSVTERPFRMGDLGVFDSRFDRFDHEEHFLFSIPLFFLKKFASHNWGERIFRPLLVVDGFMVRALPLLRPWCWVTLLHGSGPTQGERPEE